MPPVGAGGNITAVRTLGNNARMSNRENPAGLQQAAIAASEARDWPRALTLWEQLRTEFPAEALFWRNSGEAYWQAGALNRADEILGEAIAAFPDDLWMFYHYTLVAQRKADWPEALARAEDLHRRFPEFAIAAVLRGEALRELGRLDAAEAVLAPAAASRFPRDEWVLHGYAQLAVRQENWTEALRRWEAMLAVFPEHKLAVLGREEACRQLGQPTAADSAVTAVLEEVRDRDILAALPARLANPQVLIEITSICNFSCGYCVSPMKLREKKRMSLETFRRIIEQVAAITTNPVRLHVDGEPTSHPQFHEMALLVNSYGLPIWLATNGSRLDPKFLDIWMDPLISMSTSAEELAKRHAGLNFARYIGRIADYTAAWAKSAARQNLFFQIIRYPQDDTEADAACQARQNAFLVEFCGRAGLYDSCVEASAVADEVYRLSRRTHPGVVSFMKQSVSIGGLYPKNGELVERGRATAGFCDAPWRQLAIHADGTLGACCVDLSGGTTFASAAEVETIPLKTLWEEGEQITSIRRNFLAGRIERDVCQRCLHHGQVMFSPDTQ